MERRELARLLGVSARLAEPRSEPSVIAESDPARFMDAFGTAVAEGGPVFLADPAWGVNECARLRELAALPSRAPEQTRGWLCIPSGGTSGGLKFARHDEETLSAAVLGFCTHFEVKRVNAINVLPLHHVSGLMAWMRCVLTGGELRPWTWKQLESGERPVLDAGDWFLSLVPTQLQRLLGADEAVNWLCGFRAIFLGGGPTWPALADAAAAAKLPISLSYGMTETAAMVAALRRSEFAAGARSCGAPLPHVRVDVDEGMVSVSGESIFRGYWPAWSDTRTFETGDRGTIDERGHLHVHGRGDALIITGGKKVDPAEVEAWLRATGEFSDIAVIGVPDAEWGERVVALYPIGTDEPSWPKVKARLREVAAYKHPKTYLAIPSAAWPRNAQGKLHRAELVRLAQARRDAERS